MVKAIKVYIDSAYQIEITGVTPSRNKSYQKINNLNNFSRFLKFIIKAEQDLTDGGHFDILEQFKQNIRGIFSKDVLDKIHEINEAYVKFVKTDSESPETEEKLTAISDPLDSILKSHGI